MMKKPTMTIAEAAESLDRAPNKKRPERTKGGRDPGHRKKGKR